MASEMRAHLLDAAEALLREHGLPALTTREIAKRAACAEGSIYKNFGSRLELLVALVDDRLPSFSVALERLPLRVGEKTVDAILEEVVRAAIGFYRQAIPLFAAVLMEPDLREGTKNALKGSDAGPQRWRQPVEAYLRAEQRLKRVGPDVDVGEVASLLLARSLQHAFASLVFGEGSARGDAAVARTAASTVLRGCRA